MTSEVDLSIIAEFLEEIDLDGTMDEIKALDAVSEDPQAVTCKRIKSPVEREKQKGYDKKSREKKKLTHQNECVVFIQGLKMMVFMLSGRVQYTHHAIQTLQDEVLLTDGRAIQKRYLMTQVSINHELSNTAAKWVSNWELRRADNKCFMKPWADEVDPLMARLKELITHSSITNNLLLEHAVDALPFQ